jgi:hypothetical protein
MLAAVRVGVGLPALRECREERFELAGAAFAAERAPLRGDLRVVRDTERLRRLVSVADVVVVRDRLAGLDDAVVLGGLLRRLAREELGLVEGEGCGGAGGRDAPDIAEVVGRGRRRRRGGLGGGLRLRRPATLVGR